METQKRSLQLLNEDFFSKFGVSKKYKKRQIILEPNTEPSGVFYVKSGFVRLYLISKNGKEITFNIYKSGIFFPMIWALSKSPNIYFVESMTDVELLTAPREKVIEFLEKNPAVLLDLTKRILSGLEGLTKLMDILLSKNAYLQVCAIILMLSRRFGIKDKNKNIEIELPLTHYLIGSFAGLSREATSRELEKLEKNKILIQKDHKIIVKDSKKLEKEFTTYTSEHIYF